MIPAVGVVVFTQPGVVVLVRRANPPAQGLWTVPGGRVEPGESLADAARREVREETGLEVELGPVVFRVVTPAPRGESYEITDFVATCDGGVPRAGDDADAVALVPVTELAEWALAGRTQEAIEAAARYVDGTNSA